MKIWHMRRGKYARAFIQQPWSYLTRLYLLYRGWRPTNWAWWTKPNKHQQVLERNL